MTEEKRKVVVVAGGTGQLGRHIVDGIIATKKYIVKVFTRSDSSSSSNLTGKEVEVVKVDYTDHALLVKELQGVHTVIVSLISIDDSCIQSQLNLLNASLEAKVKRFAPSEFAGNHGANSAIQLERELKVPVRNKIKASGIEYTVFMNGLLMEYFASPQKASPYLDSFIIGVDFNKCQANIVGTGDEPFCVTRCDDVGRFVAAALDLNKWDERSGMIGSRTTYNELIKLGEQLRRNKFQVTRATADQALSQCDPKPENRMVNLVQEVLVATSRGELDIDGILNKKCAQIKPTTIEDFLTKWWAGKEGEIF